MIKFDQLSLLTGDELSEQVLGPFIVKQSKRRDPHSGLYDHDEVPHVLLVEYSIPQNGISEMQVNGNASNTVC